MQSSTGDWLQAMEIEVFIVQSCIYHKEEEWNVTGCAKGMTRVIASMHPLELISALYRHGDCARVRLSLAYFLLEFSSGDYPSWLMISAEAWWPQRREETLVNKISLSSTSFFSFCIRCCRTVFSFAMNSISEDMPSSLFELAVKFIVRGNNM